MVLPFPLFTFSQSINFSGELIHAASEIKVQNAHLLLINDDHQYTTVSDSGGHFLFKDIHAGEYKFIVSHLNFERLDTTIELVQNIRQTISLQPIANELNELKITALEKNSQVNDMSQVSTHTFSMKFAEKFPAVLEDPGRIAMLFAGVSGGKNDAQNDVTVRGNNPRGNMWRVEELDLHSPNHFTEEGRTGGTVSMISGHIMDKSDFLTAAYPAEYGNAIGGVFDIKLRNGAYDKYVVKTRVSLIGAELFSEGPFSHKASYLVNYRYSTLALVEKMGIDIKGLEAPVFQDFNYKFQFKIGTRSEINLFGVNGWSEVNKEKKNKDDFGTQELLKRDINHYGHIFNGANYHVRINERSRFAIIAGLLNTKYGNEQSIQDSNLVFELRKIDHYNRNVIKLHGYFHNQWTNLTLKSGIMVDQIFFDLNGQKMDDSLQILTTSIREINNTRYYRLYSSAIYTPNPRLTMVAGLHQSYFEVNKRWRIEPRFSVQYNIYKKHFISYGTGLYNKLENLITYYQKVENDNGEVEQPNQNLKFMKSWHNVLAYNFVPNDAIQFSVEAYHQFLYDVPVTDTSGEGKNIFYSAINDRGIINKDRLISDGKGWNYGLDVSFSLFTLNKWLAVVNGSVYSSKYKGSDGVIRNSVWNNNFSIKLITGKEFNLGKKKKDELRIGLNTQLAGGKRYPVIDEAASLLAGQTIYNLEDSYNEKGPLYYRIDVMFTYTRYMPKCEIALRLDIQNATNRTYLVDEEFEAGIGIVQDRRGQILPVLSASFAFDWDRK